MLALTNLQGMQEIAHAKNTEFILSQTGLNAVYFVEVSTSYFHT